MTPQPFKVLINDHPTIDFGPLKLVNLFRGTHSDFHNLKPIDYPIEPDVPAKTARPSCNWSGYVETLRLNSEGTMSIVKFDYPNDSNPDSTQHVDKLIDGDFLAFMSEEWADPITFVQFLDGRITDPSEWIQGG